MHSLHSSGSRPCSCHSRAPPTTAGQWRTQTAFSVQPSQTRQRPLRSAAIDASQLIVVSGTPEQYFPAADLHAACFGHNSGPNQALFERFDRIWGLQINDDLQRRGAGRCKLLLAFDPSRCSMDVLTQLQQQAAAANTCNSSSSSSSTASLSVRPNSIGNGSTSSSNGNDQSNGDSMIVSVPDLDVFAFPRLGYWLSRLVDKQVKAGLGTTHEAPGIVGAAQVDTFNDLIPPKALSATRDGAFGWLKRSGYAYISNVAVSTAYRRSGVAARLMAEAESLAATWGCRTAGLHCNPKNTAAMQLYKQLKYKKAALEAPWMPYLQGRAPDRCYLLVKRLPHSQQQQQQADATPQAVAAEAAAATYH